MKGVDKEKVVSADVLVIGGGVAGIFTAIEAHKHGADVLLLTKGMFGRDGAASWMVGEYGGTYIEPPDTVEEMAKEGIIGSRYLNDQDQVLAYLKACAINNRELNDMYKWGYRFKRKDGNFVPKKSAGGAIGHSRPRSVEIEGAETFSLGFAGSAMRRVLCHRVQVLKLKTMSDIFISDLLTVDNRCAGAVGIDLNDGEFKVFNAKVTVLATGGMEACYSLTDANYTLTGDGHAIAWRAGAEMTNMEFPDLFMPIDPRWPPIISTLCYHPAYFMYAAGAATYNAQGDRFMAFHRVEHQGRRLEWQDRAVRSVYSRAIRREIREGRGIHGGVWLSMRHLPRNYVDEKIKQWRQGLPIQMAVLDQIGIDLHDDGIIIAPGTHYTLAGVETNIPGQSNIEGLYAVGEVQGTKNGANRLEGYAIRYCIGMGYITGEHIGKRVKELKMPKIDWNKVDELRERAYTPLEPEKGTRPIELKRRITSLFDEYYMFGRTKEGLEKALSEIEKMKKELPLYVKARNKRFNFEHIEALEVMNILDIGGMIGRSAIMRTESRGAHERLEYPNADPAWMKRIVTWQENGVPKFREVPIKCTLVEPPKDDQQLRRFTA